MEKFEIITFKNNSLQLDVNVSPEEETVWLTLDQMSELFGRDKSVISRHINSIYKDKELEKETTIAKNATMLYGRKYISYMYNLDVIISVGYRVKSKNGVIFRKWANQVLKEYLLKGFCVSDRAYVLKENYLNLYNKVLSLDEEIDKLKKEIAKIKPNAEIFYKGQYFESQLFINSLIEDEVNNNLTIIDPYFDSKALENFKIKKKIKSKLITSMKSKLNDALLNSFSKEFFPILKKISEEFHDRFLILDDEKIYHIGTSFNYLGKHIFIVSNIVDECWCHDFIEMVKKI